MIFIDLLVVVLLLHGDILYELFTIHCITYCILHICTFACCRYIYLHVYLCLYICVCLLNLT